MPTCKYDFFMLFDTMRCMERGILYYSKRKKKDRDWRGVAGCEEKNFAKLRMPFLNRRAYSLENNWLSECSE